MQLIDDLARKEIIQKPSGNKNIWEKIVRLRTRKEISSMRKLLMMFAMLGGVALAGASPASSNAASGLAVKPNTGVAAPSMVEEARWKRRRWGHRRGWKRRGWRRGLYFGFGPGVYGYYGYPRYGYNRRYYRRGYHRGWRGHRHYRRW
jgi:hypothetical protein